jgi:thiol-disulfide isomerase/thioredoxin
MTLSTVIMAQFAAVSMAAAGSDRELSAVVAALDELEDYAGKVVYVDFWASWCAPCKKSFPWMQSMYDEYADQGLVIIAVNLDDDRRKAERFLAGADPSFLVRYDDGAGLAKHFELQAMPTSLVFDRRGRLVSRHEGFENGDRAQLRAEIEGLIHSTGATDLGK